ncbi:MAG: hypothetical protein R3B13_39805 [Polyangiaceae bacterium]
MVSRFYIELRPEVGHEAAVVFVSGEAHSFELDLGCWRRDEYVESWRMQLRELLAGEDRVALLTRLPEGAADGLAFVCERIDLSRALVRILECSFDASQIKSATDVLENPHLGRAKRELGVVSLGTIAQFLERPS